MMKSLLTFILVLAHTCLGQAALSVDTGKDLRSYSDALASLEEVWSYDEKVLCAGAGVHGHMEKTAFGGRNPSLDHRMNPEVADLYLFEGLPIYAPSKFLVSHKHKFIYVRQPKSSSSAIIDAIQRTFCKAHKCTRDEFMPFTSLEGMEQTWKDYYVFTWVRNPFSRIVSAYKMMSKKYLVMREGPDGTDVGERCSVSFLTYTQNTNSLRSDCQIRGCCIYISVYKQWIPWFIAAHINDQSHAVFSGDGGSMVDFIGRTENIEEDWNEMLLEFNARMKTSYKPMEFTLVNQAADTQEQAAKTELCPGHESLRSYLNETTMFNIAKQYSRDLVLFDYFKKPAVETA